MLLRRATLAGLLLLLAGGSCRRDPAPSAISADPPRVQINGRVWSVELATTDFQRYRGLSGRTELAEDAGMLFIHPQPRKLEYCMRDCHIPLDIAFIDPDLRVVAIHTMKVEPDRVGRAPYGSGKAARYALEVPGGALGRAGVKIGQKVTFLGDVPTKAAPSW